MKFTLKDEEAQAIASACLNYFEEIDVRKPRPDKRI